MGDLCSLKEKLMLWLYRNLLVHISGPDTCTRTASTTESLKGHGHEPSLSPQNPFGLNGQTPITPPPPADPPKSEVQQSAGAFFPTLLLKLSQGG